MLKRPKLEELLFVVAKITTQEVQIGSSGDGSLKYPRHIGTYIELSGSLETPLKGTSPIAISVSELEGSLQDAGFKPGMINSVKPVVRCSIWVDQKIAGRLVTLIAARRLTDFYAHIEPPRYGRGWVHSWSLMTAPEEG
ncbi:hypothetical protein [Mesorhizobium sp. dw_380]|uniref:hypothetical protein n=1 Tax=Mesorhizobium sp. dw_380 TaxID=2812001 RepID=UPI001BDEBEE5|nr:hypothetical protein [Mesorhizobium sp. dw_380]